jgi:hypothetical protein
VYVVVWDVLEAINKRIDNIKFPYGDEVKLRDLEQSFWKFNRGFFPGTVAAGDGIVFRIWRPPAYAVDGNVTSFFNRKGFYGFGMQGFCDGDCKFVHISMKTCSSTHDSTAYIVSGMSKVIEQGLLPSSLLLSLFAANYTICAWIDSIQVIRWKQHMKIAFG